MFDLYINASFSHAFLMGLVGWIFWAYEGHRQGGGPQWLLATSGLLALAIATHPQHAIKLYLILALYVLMTRWGDLRDRPGAMLAHAVILFGLPVLLVAFKVVEWLALYHGANSLAMVQDPEPWRTPLTNLFTLPGFILGYLAQRVLGWSPLSVPYMAAEGSDYLGLSVVALALAAVGSLRRENPTLLRALVTMLAFCGVFYYVLASLALIQRIPGWATYISMRDRWVFLGSFLLALLAGYGAREIAGGVGSRRHAWVRPALSAVLLIDVAGISLAMAGMLGTHARPLDLPLPAEWRRSGLAASSDRGHRVLDLVKGGSNETVAALIPLAIGVRSGTPDLANALAMPNEYYAFYSSLVGDLGGPARAAGLAERLALLNAGTVRIDPTALPSDPAARAAVLDRLHQEGGLGPWPVVGAAGYFFRNPRAAECLVPRGAIAIVGEDRQGEAFFEQVARLTGFDVRTLLPVLVPDPSRLPPDAAAHLRGAVPVGAGRLPAGWTPLSLDGIQRLFAETGAPGAAPATCEVFRPDHYVVDLRLGPRDRAGFVFLSQSYFEQPGYANPWVAEDEQGRGLPTVKAGAGLTAVWAPAPVRAIRLRFQLPTSKRIGAWVSLGGWVGWLAAVGWTLAHRPGGRRGAAAEGRL
jgi:hypothetical protein